MKRIIRDRYLTDEEIQEDRRVRDLIEAEKPDIIARHKERMALKHAASTVPDDDRETADASDRSTTATKSQRNDGQKTGLAGEFFVAAELLRRGFQTSVTLGNAKAIDLVAVHPQTGRVFTIQVKAVRTRNEFLIGHGRIQREQVYVFAILNNPGEAVQFFIVPGSILADEPDRFGKWFRDPKCPRISPSLLQDFANAWNVFDERLDG